MAIFILYVEIQKNDFHPVGGCLCGVMCSKILDESHATISIPDAVVACGQKEHLRQESSALIFPVFSS